MRVSKEFIEAMNGVLNSEKWRRTGWTNDLAHLLIKVDPTDYATPCYKYLYSSFDYQAHLSVDDMTAIDWVKVEV